MDGQYWCAHQKLYFTTIDAIQNILDNIELFFLNL